MSRLAPGRLLEEAPDAGAVAERLPVDVVLAVLVGIDEGDELDVVALEEAGADLALRLGAAADLRHQDHVARRDEPAAAEHAARDDGERRRRGEKLPAIDVHHGWLYLL